MQKGSTVKFYPLLIICISTLNFCKGDILPGLITFTMTEDSEVPLILGDILEHLRLGNHLHMNISDVLIFPSSQPFSDYFQLLKKTYFSLHSGQILISTELQLIKQFDLETACKRRLSAEQCFQPNYACCCDHQGLYCSIKLQLAATIGGSILHTAAEETTFRGFLAEVKILDQNDQTPLFTPNSFILKVMEGAKHSEAYRLPVARDGDLGQNAEVAYAIASVHGQSPNSKIWQLVSKVNEIFLIKWEPHTLSIVIEGCIDRENIEVYRILIEAWDMAADVEKRRTGTLTLLLLITDVNDVSPVFESRNLSVHVIENSAIGTVVRTIFAQDYDSGVNGQVRYSISPSQLEHPFKIDSHTGILSIADEVDREKHDKYEIIIEAIDYGNPARTSTLPVFINILDTNDNAPSINISSSFMANSGRQHLTSEEVVILSIPESFPLEGNLANVTVSDPDLEGNTTAYCFTLEENFILVQTFRSVYSLHLKRALDYETSKYVQLKISCEDSGRPRPLTSEVQVKIVVLNENDNPPIFQDPIVIPPAWLLNDTEVAKFSAVLGTTENVTQYEKTGSIILFLPKSFPLGDVFLRFRATDADFEYETEGTAPQLCFHLYVYSVQHFHLQSHSISTLLPDKPNLFRLSEWTGDVSFTSAPNSDGIIYVYKGIVVVQDSSSAPLSTSKNFTFIVAESNPNAPAIRIFNFALSNSLSSYQIYDQNHNASLQVVPFYIPLQIQSKSVIGQVVGFDSDPGQAGLITYNLILEQSGCLNVSINNSTGILVLLATNRRVDYSCQVMASLNVSDNGFPRHFTHLYVKFQLFDEENLAPKILINHSVIFPTRNTNNRTVWHFKTILPRKGEPLFKVKVDSLPGLIEPLFRTKLCSIDSATSDGALVGVFVDESTGTICTADNFTDYPNKSLYIMVYNHLWPSSLPTILKTEMKTDANGTTTVYITSTESIICKYPNGDGPGSGRYFKTFCSVVVIIAGVLCLTIILLIVPMKKLRRPSIFKKKDLPRVYDETESTGKSLDLIDKTDLGRKFEDRPNDGE